ncbi:mechanosensitive ion channel family protein [Paenibacillus sp. GCM10012307]|uniref:Mechanosensitive ion channel family protein n=1 Tax=Paenibacillus roseus TaxID=2798579 RepID=A0A934MP43_9BACL|nr:mechanosensitive ion channel family protein [Paenibacillus roseus]MBJ6361676.1 mechanosensitive ion channel family protein [Paenibacillus roseus]
MGLQSLYQSIITELSNEKLWQTIGWSAFRIILILVLGRVSIIIVNKTIDHVVFNREPERLGQQVRRIRTIGKLLKNVVAYAIHFVSVLLILSEFNINLGPLLAGAGVIGLAIGFGAQSLVKDVISGFFIVVEDQFAVGDIIQTGNFKGTVELIGLRSTRIQNWTGEVHIIPNGMINEVTNFSINNSLAVLDVSIAFEENIDRTVSAINGILARIDDPNLIKAPEVLGIQTLTATEASLRIVAECRPTTQVAVSRVLNREIKKALDANQIEMAYPRMITYQQNKEGRASNGT